MNSPERGKTADERLHGIRENTKVCEEPHPEKTEREERTESLEAQERNLSSAYEEVFSQVRLLLFKNTAHVYTVHYVVYGTKCLTLTKEGMFT